jgi:hypothetical protein
VQGGERRPAREVGSLLGGRATRAALPGRGEGKEEGEKEGRDGPSGAAGGAERPVSNVPQKPVAVSVEAGFA